jgi:hypothetical protein
MQEGVNPISALCQFCGKPCPAQLDLSGNIAVIQYVCKKCRRLPKDDKILLYDGAGWRAYIELDDFKTHIIAAVPKDGLFRMSREASIKVARDASKHDENYINSCRRLDNLCGELEESQCEVSRLKSEIDDTKNELDGYLNDYLHELFHEVKA